MWLLLHTVQSDKNEHPTNIFTGGASSCITNPWMDNSEGADVMLHHLVNLATVCTTHFNCTTNMARTSEPDFLQTESRADDKGEASGKARGGGSRVAGELAAAAADSDQAARQLHWPAAHTRIPSTPPRISAARPSCEHMPWHRAATPGTGIHHSCINPVFSEQDRARSACWQVFGQAILVCATMAPLWTRHRDPGKGKWRGGVVR